MELGPSELVMAAAVARRYYLSGESKVEIVAALGISRFKVARILESARENGLVRIEIGQQGPIDPDLSAQLQQRFSLHHCVVVVAQDEHSARHLVGAAAAELLAEIVTRDDVLGLPWARAVSEMIAALPTLPPIPVIQLSGSLVIPGETSPVDLVRRAARLSGGESHVFYAPLLLDDAESALALRRQPSVADRETISALGVIGEVAGVFYNAAGQPVATPLDERLLTITAEQMRGIPEVIGVAYGAAKAETIRASVLGGLVDSLVVDSEVARRMLQG